MRIPKSVINKIRDYQKAKSQYNKLYNELESWFEENADSGVLWNDFEFADKPKGQYLGDGEWCEQYEAYYSPDCGNGTMYYEVKGKYIAASYDF